MTIKPGPLAALALGLSLCAAPAAFSLEAVVPAVENNDMAASPEPAQSPEPSPVSINPFSRQKEPALAYPADPADKSHAAEMVFDIPMPLDIPAVAEKRAQYLSKGGLDYLEAVFRRAAPYWCYINERIAYYGLPSELAYLPIIESEFSPAGVSRSGAAGLWQFMRNSISGLNIKIDDWRDDRRDFMRSTDAALRKLMWNYQTYNDWNLALAAYNCGTGAMDRAIRKSGTRDYWELCAKKALPKETRNYVPKFLAIASIVKYGGRYGMDASWAEPVSWETVPLDRSVDLSLVAEKANVPLDLLKKGNAELRYNVTPPGDKSYCLKVPAGYGQAVSDVVNDKSLKLIKYYIYTIRSGDTLRALALHYGVSVDMILGNNPSLKPKTLRIGAKVIIPAMKDVSPYEGKRPTDAAGAFRGSYVVKAGDTLYSIALRFGVQPETLADRNGIEMNSILRLGQKLSVPELS
jgi:membrane-bound lytic murein transglycosylase D